MRNYFPFTDELQCQLGTRVNHRPEEVKAMQKQALASVDKMLVERFHTLNYVHYREGKLVEGDDVQGDLKRMQTIKVDLIAADEERKYRNASEKLISHFEWEIKHGRDISKYSRFLALGRNDLKYIANNKGADMTLRHIACVRHNEVLKVAK